MSRVKLSNPTHARTCEHCESSFAHGLGPERVPAAGAAPASGAEASDAFFACDSSPRQLHPTNTVFPLCTLWRRSGGGGARVHLAALGRREQQGGRCRRALRAAAALPSTSPSAASRHHGGRPATRAGVRFAFRLSAKGKGTEWKPKQKPPWIRLLLFLWGKNGKMAEPVGFY